MMAFIAMISALFICSSVIIWVTSEIVLLGVFPAQSDMVVPTGCGIMTINEADQHQGLKTRCMCLIYGSL